MESEFITLTKDNIGAEHICCAFSNPKTSEGYELKKLWLTHELKNGYVFRKLDARAKVFIEYVPAERAWVPVTAPNYLMVNCLWVAGQYKGHGYGKALLQSAIDDALRQGKNGLVTVVGTKKLPFMSDTKWMLRQGFETVDTLPYGFSLLSLKLISDAADPFFNACVREGLCEDDNVPAGNRQSTIDAGHCLQAQDYKTSANHDAGHCLHAHSYETSANHDADGHVLTVYYSNRCPFTENYINGALREIALKHNIALKIKKIENIAQAQNAPTPATIFTAFLNGKYLTNDLSICSESKFLTLLKL